MAELEWSALWNYVLSLQSFRTLLDFELHFLSFIQRFVTIGLNGGKMHEHIFARLALNEAKTLRSVEPLHDTLLFAHGIPLLLNSLLNGVFAPARCRFLGVHWAGGKTSFLNAALCWHKSACQSSKHCKCFGRPNLSRSCAPRRIHPNKRRKPYIVS